MTLTPDVSAAADQIVGDFVEHAGKNASFIICSDHGFKWDGGCKTGTAQFGGTGADLPSHAWFIDFAPYVNPEFASATILEGAGFGEYVAEPVAVQFMNYYYDHRAQIHAGD